MKSMTTKLMMTAAALAIASVASAQTYRAEIPFSFQAGGKLMSPGTYMVRMNDPQQKLVVFSNYDAKQAVILLTYPGESRKDMTGNAAPSLTFECGIGRCALARLWTGSTGPAIAFPHRRPGNSEQASLTEIRLVKSNGD